MNSDKNSLISFLKSSFYFDHVSKNIKDNINKIIKEHTIAGRLSDKFRKALCALSTFCYNSEVLLDIKAALNNK